MMVALTFSLYAQDTIQVPKVMIANRVINKKTGKVVKVFYRKLKVKKGYIVNKGNGIYEINGKLMKADNIDTLIAKK